MHACLPADQPVCSFACVCVCVQKCRLVCVEKKKEKNMTRNFFKTAPTLRNNFISSSLHERFVFFFCSQIFVHNRRLFLVLFFIVFFFVDIFFVSVSPKISILQIKMHHRVLGWIYFEENMLPGTAMADGLIHFYGSCNECNVINVM